MAIVWERRSKIRAFEMGQVQLWRLSTDEVRATEEMARRELTAQEQVRAGQFRVELARAEFVFGRCLLRRLLGAAGDVKANEVVLRTGAFGKPEAAAIRDIDFNVSHSRGVILVAISRAGPVGVDVEYVDDRRTASEFLEMAKDILGFDEVTALWQMEAGEDALKACYQAWTRREAVAKASGDGIAAAGTYKLSREGDARYVATLSGGECGEVSRYFLHSLEVRSGYVGTVAICQEAPTAYYDAAALFF